MFNKKILYNTTSDFYKKQLKMLLILACIFWLPFDYTNLDLALRKAFFDASTNSWPYYDTFFTKKIGYDWIKFLLIAYGLTLIFLLAYSYKNHYWQKRRNLIIFLLACLIIIPSEIGLLKSVALKPRPEQIVEFGGTMPHVKLYQFLPSEPTARNWPGGHASGGAALMGFYFIWSYKSLNWQRLGLFLGVFTSQFMGFIQVMRGQHFFSHNLWTLWFAWLTILLPHFFIFRPIKNPPISNLDNNN